MLPVKMRMLWSPRLNKTRARISSRLHNLLTLGGMICMVFFLFVKIKLLKICKCTKV